MTTALFGTTPAEFTASNREWLERETPVMVTVTAPIELSFDDLVAALYQIPALDSSDDKAVRLLIADAVFNEGTMSIARWRDEVAEIRRGTPEFRWLTECRSIITRVFGTPAAPARSKSRSPRVLAGVAS